jgi:hypothetical protein
METRIDLRPSQVAIVIGIDHKIQHLVAVLPPNHPRNALRFRFQEFLEEITGGYRVDVICEEAKHGVVSIAGAVANRESIPYRNIEMPPELRKQLGISELYTVDLPGSETPPEQKEACNAMRESYMINELLRSVAGARTVIGICGVSHMPALIQVLGEKFERVEKYDVTMMRRFDRSSL